MYGEKDIWGKVVSHPLIAGAGPYTLISCGTMLLPARVDIMNNDEYKDEQKSNDHTCGIQLTLFNPIYVGGSDQIPKHSHNYANNKSFVCLDDIILAKGQSFAGTVLHCVRENMKASQNNVFKRKHCTTKQDLPIKSMTIQGSSSSELKDDIVVQFDWSDAMMSNESRNESNSHPNFVVPFQHLNKRYYLKHCKNEATLVSEYYVYKYLQSLR